MDVSCVHKWDPEHGFVAHVPSPCTVTCRQSPFTPHTSTSEQPASCGHSVTCFDCCAAHFASIEQLVLLQNTSLQHMVFLLHVSLDSSSAVQGVFDDCSPDAQIGMAKQHSNGKGLQVY